MSSDHKTDRFRPVFEPEDIFERFVKNANASTEGAKPREDEPTGQITAEKAEKVSAAQPAPPSADEPRGGPPSWDHRITVLASPATVEALAAEEDDDAAPTPAVEPPKMRTVAEEDRGTVRVRSPYGEDLSKSVELPDVEVDEDVETRVARSPLLYPPKRSRPKRPMGLTDKATAVQPSELRRALAGQAVRSTEQDIASDAATPVADREGTRPDAPMPLAMARAFDADSEPESLDDGSEDLTVPRASPLLTDSGQRILLLTKRKQTETQTDKQAETQQQELPPSEPKTPLVDHDILADLSSQTWKSVVAARGQHTQRLEAMKVVPDVEAAQKKKEGTAVVEGGEDGQMPTRQLDQILSDMAVLLRYGHAGQVRERLDDLRRTYPEDLLLLRAIAEFYVENELKDAALETLFVLAGGLFERRNVEGMRQALEQVCVLDPGNERAFRLLGLLEQRSG